jgi:hypothetical protein
MTRRAEMVGPGMCRSGLIFLAHIEHKKVISLKAECRSGKMESKKKASSWILNPYIYMFNIIHISQIHYSN